MEHNPPFRETRREPTDRRSWRQTPVFAGDAAVFIDEPSHLMLVTGVLPRGRLEVVSVERAKRAVGDVHDFGSLHAAISEGRIYPRAARRRDVAPATEGIAEAAADSEVSA